jgi:hypothetical protein
LSRKRGGTVGFEVLLAGVLESSSPYIAIDDELDKKQKRNK